MIREILQKTEEQLLAYTKKELKKLGYNYIFRTDNYLLAIGTEPVMLVAHLDTVHKELPETLIYDKEQEMLWSPEGIGGDDRCGVYAILEIAKEHKPYILFTTQEEVGGIGAEIFIEEVDIDLKQLVKFIIEIDRRGNNQAVFYNCGNEDFINFITSYGFEEEWGTFSDISVLSPAYDIASVNLSAGYYNEHTKTEYIDLIALQNTIDKVKEILSSKDLEYYSYQENKSYWSKYNKFNKYDKDYDYDSYYDRYYKDDKEIENQILDTQKDAIEEDDDDEIELTDIELEELIIEDYENLTDADFYEIYGKEKPATERELIDNIDDYKCTK